MDVDERGGLGDEEERGGLEDEDEEEEKNSFRWPVARIGKVRRLHFGFWAV